jgi:hypothetical protein
MDDRNSGVGFVSYEWEGAPAGVIDALSGGTALIGIDEAIRFFNRRQSKGFSTEPYEIPVLTREGSWVAVILGLIGIPAAAFATAYAKKAGEKMAERDFSNLGMKDVAAKSMDALVKLIRLIKQQKGTPDWKSINITWSSDATTAKFQDGDGNTLEIPAEYIGWYKDLPKNIIKKLATPIVRGRTMTVGALQKSGEFDTVHVDENTGALLNGDNENDDDDEFLFPEMKHGDTIVLEGLITRGNQATNSIGFQYQGHILNCTPQTGNVKKFKPAMFLHSRITATVNRHVTSLAKLDYRPTLLISHVVMLEDDGTTQQNLF